MVWPSFQPVQLHSSWSHAGINCVRNSAWWKKAITAVPVGGVCAPAHNPSHCSVFGHNWTHTSHGCWGEIPRRARAASASAGHQLQLSALWAQRCGGARAAGEAALFLRGSDRHGHKRQPQQETDFKRYIRLYRIKLPLLWEEQKRMAKQHQAQFVSQRVLRQGAQGERRGQEGQLLDAGPGFWGYVWEGQLPAAEEGEATVQTAERALPARDAGGVSRAALPAAVRERVLGSVPASARLVPRISPGPHRPSSHPQLVPDWPVEFLLPSRPLPPPCLRRVPPAAARPGPAQA